MLIIQNDIGNRYSPTVICAAITSRMNKTKLPTHIEIFSGEYEIEKDSVILLEQLRTIDKKRLKDKVCHLDARVMNLPEVMIGQVQNKVDADAGRLIDGDAREHIRRQLDAFVRFIRR